MRLFGVIRRVSCLFKVSLNDIYDELNAAVLRTSFGSAVVGTRVGFAVSFRSHALSLNALVEEVAAYGSCTLLRENEVLIFVTYMVGVAVDCNRVLRVSLQNVRNVVKRRI